MKITPELKLNPLKGILRKGKCFPKQKKMTLKDLENQGFKYPNQKINPERLEAYQEQKKQLASTSCNKNS